MEAQRAQIYIESFAGAATNIVDQITVTLTDENNAPIPNLTGATSTFKAKTSYSSSETVISVSTPSGIAVNGTTGVVTLTLTVADLAQINTGIEEQTFVYDWDLVDNTGKFIRLLKGELVIGGDV